MSFFDLFRKTTYKEKTGRFSDFFLHASDSKKEEVLREAARKANEEQREMLMKSRMKEKVI